MAESSSPLQRWRPLIVRFSVLLGTLVLSRLALAAKDILVADRFGTSDDIDAFIAASALPLFFVYTVALMLGDAFLPVFVRGREVGGHETSQRILSEVTALSLVSTLLIGLGIVVTSPLLIHLLAANFTGGKLDHATQLLRLLAPLICLGTLSSVFGGALLALGKERLTAFVQVATPALTILFLVAVPTPTAGALVAGAVFGAAVEALVLLLALRRAGFSVRPRWNGATAEIRSLLGQFAPGVVGQVLATACVLVDQSMAAGLESGAVSSLSYGMKITLTLLNLGGVSLSMMVFPRFATLSARGEWGEVWSLFKRIGIASFALSALGTLLLILLSTPITRLLFERGAFTPADTAQAALIQQYFALQIPFNMVARMASRVLTSLSRNEFLTLSGALNFGVNIIGNLILSRYMGVVGIALSTSLVMIVSAIATTFFVWRVLRAAAAKGATSH